MLARRSAFREALEPLGRVIEAWDASPGRIAPLPWTAGTAHRLWAEGKPLLAGAAPHIASGDVEPLLHAALDLLDPLEDTRPYAEAWDRGDIDAAALLPSAHGLGATRVLERSGLSQHAVAFLSLAALRPSLVSYFSTCRTHIDAALWNHGVCPCCGAPPGFADLLEDGRRQLACHLCDARWTFARLACVFCGNNTPADVVRLIAEDADEGYGITACRTCRGYIKDVDRRARWNAGSPIVEDWGSPHLDLIAERRQFWRPIPTIVQLTGRAAEG